MLYFPLFFLELGFLFFLSKKLISYLAKTFYKLHFSHKTVVNILAVLFLPGTILHELAHLLVAGVLLIPVGELSVLPEVEEESVKLGSVQIAKSDPIRMTLVGIAPIIVGVGAILGVSFLNFTIWWQAILGLYLIFEIGNSMFSSKRDLEGVVGFLAAMLIVGIVTVGSLYFLNQNLFQTIWSYLTNLNFEGVDTFLKQAALYLIVPISLDLMIILVVKLIK